MKKVRINYDLDYFSSLLVKRVRQHSFVTHYLSSCCSTNFYVNMGLSIKGPVKRKNTFPPKKIHLFLLVLSLSYQHRLALSPFFTLIISFLSVSSQPKLIRTSHSSGTFGTFRPLVNQYSSLQMIVSLFGYPFPLIHIINHAGLAAFEYLFTFYSPYNYMPHQTGCI